MFLVMPPAPAPGEAWVETLDVGNGLALVVRTAQHAIAYDAGPAWSDEADSGNRIGQRSFGAFTKRICRVAVGAPQITSGEPDKNARQPGKGAFALQAEIDFIDDQRVRHPQSISLNPHTLTRTQSGRAT